MKDENKTKEQLIQELEEMRQQIGYAELSEAERKRVWEVAQETERRYRLVAENAADVIWTVGLDMRLTYISPSITRLLGYSVEEAMAKTMKEIFTPASFEVATKVLAEELAIEKTEQKDLSRSRVLDFELKRKDGSIVPAEINYSFLRGADSQPFGILAIARDITERKQMEEVLRESEERYRAFFKTSRDCVFITTRDGRWVDFNDDAAEFFGYENSNELRKVKISALYEHTEERGRITQTIEQQGFVKGLAVNFRRKDGSIINSLLTAVARTDENGNIIGYQGTVKDVTERKQAEEAVKKEKERAEEYLNIAGVMLAILNADEKISLINKKGCEILGYKEGELIGRNWFDTLVPQRMRAEIRGVFGKLMAGDIKPVEYYENPLLTKSGEERIIAFHNTVIRESDGQIVGVLLSGEDITERKQMEEALRSSEEKYRTLVNNVRLGIFRSTTEPGGKFLEVNPAMEEITGYNRRELLQVDIANLYVNPEERNQILEEVVSGKRKTTREVLFRKKDGAEIVISDTKVAVRDDTGKFLYFDGIMEDITERKQMEEKAREIEALKELDRMQTELLANVSHELRTPLATIKGYSTMLLDYDTRLKRDEKRSYLGFIDKASDRLVELIDQLLDMSRLESGAIELDKATTTVSKLIREVVTEAQIRKPGRRLVFNMPKRLPRLYIDARRIQQVLENIIDNAIKYSEEETEVVISARQVEQEVIISIADQGIGIPAEDLPKVFDRIYRTRQRKVMEVGGAGLGLSICQKLVEAHGGRIWIESEEGKGTTCYFTLPQATEEDRRGNEA